MRRTSITLIMQKGGVLAAGWCDEGNDWYLVIYNLLLSSLAENLHLWFGAKKKKMFYLGARNMQRERAGKKEHVHPFLSAQLSMSWVGEKGKDGWKCVFPARQAAECFQPWFWQSRGWSEVGGWSINFCALAGKMNQVFQKLSFLFSKSLKAGKGWAVKRKQCSQVLSG